VCLHNIAWCAVSLQLVAYLGHGEEEEEEEDTAAQPLYPTSRKASIRQSVTRSMSSGAMPMANAGGEEEGGVAITEASSGST